MKTLKLKYTLAVIPLLLACYSYALVVNNTVFVERGGDLNNTAATFRTVYESLRQTSNSPQYLSVGTVSTGCTATWVGDSTDGSFIYILLAAQCVRYKALQGSTTIQFHDYANRLIGNGGTYYVPPQLLTKPAGYGVASTNIALLKLSKVNQIFDTAGERVAEPILNDIGDERGKNVHFVGYGFWGTAKDGTRREWSPATGARRAWGMSKINRIFEENHGIATKFTSIGSVYWANTVQGDIGSAWWQEQAGKYYIVAIANGGSSVGATGARVSAYTTWIRSIAPGLKWRSLEIAQGSPAVQ